MKKIIAFIILFSSVAFSQTPQAMQAKYGIKLDSIICLLKGAGNGIRIERNDTTWMYIYRDSVFLGSTSNSSRLIENYNGIVAPMPGNLANIITGICLINNTTASNGVGNNSPALQLKHFSWNPTAGASQENSWYAHNWGFNTTGTSGGVLVFTNNRPSDPNVYSTFAIDEIGRTLIGYAKSQGSDYYGFWGEDFGSWGVILASSQPVVVGWPENSITTNFRVTGNTTLSGTANAIGTVTSGTIGGTTIINTSGTITTSNLITANYPALIINYPSGTATIDIKGKSGSYNTGMSIFRDGSLRWIVGCHDTSDFTLYSHDSFTDILTVSPTLFTFNAVTKFTQDGTGAGTALLATNCPASTVAAPYTWLTMQSSDGSTVYVPAWK